jgi:hypothetical protein
LTLVLSIVAAARLALKMMPLASVSTHGKRHLFEGDTTTAPSARRVSACGVELQPGAGELMYDSVDKVNDCSTTSSTSAEQRRVVLRGAVPQLRESAIVHRRADVFVSQGKSRFLPGFPAWPNRVRPVELCHAHTTLSFRGGEGQRTLLPGHRELGKVGRS